MDENYLQDLFIDEAAGSLDKSSVPKGGTTGQVLVKKSNNDHDTEWKTFSGGGGGSGESGVCSTDETIIGTWVDGKPLYEITIIGNAGEVEFNHTTGTGDNTVADLSDKNIDTVRRIEGTLMFGGTAVPLGSTAGTNTAFNKLFFYQINYQSSGMVTVRWTGTSPKNALVIATLQYTKTTDTATTALPTSEEMTNAYDEGVQSA